jgi:hypothetical protein
MDAPDETQNKLTELDEARKEAEEARGERQQLEADVARIAAEVDRPVKATQMSASVAIRAVRDDPKLIAKLSAAKDGKVTDRSTTQLVNALGDIESTAEKAAAAWRLFQEEVLHRRRWPTLIALILFAAGVVLAWVVTGWSGEAKALAVVAAVVGILVPALQGTLKVLYLAREAREARELPLAEKRDELARAKAKEEKAEQEVAQREQDLADLRDKGLQMQRFVRERAASSDYRGKLGVISQIRRDFEKLLVLTQSTQPTDKQHVPDVERIFLFIDDLDRCPQDRVVEVLQAVHLLLAFKLFVVVVGVDSQWLERSLRVHYKNLLEEPTSYLEKIFQIPFTLRRMTLDCCQDLIEGLTVPSNQPSEHFDQILGRLDPTSIGQAQSLAEDFDEDDIEDDSPTFSPMVTAPAETEPSQPSPLPRPEALVISSDERELLGKIGVLVSTPRTAKRLVNIYRMLRVSVPDSKLEAFLPNGGDEYQAVVLLLGILIGRPSWAPKVFQRLETSDLDDVWKVLTEFTEVYNPLATIRNDIKVTQTGPYRRWAPRVARFSFRLSDIQREDGESVDTHPEN